MSTTPPKKEVNTNSEAKQTNVLGNKKPLKTDKTKNVSDNTKEDDSENSRKKLKFIYACNYQKKLIYYFAHPNQKLIQTPKYYTSLESIYNF